MANTETRRAGFRSRRTAFCRLAPFALAGLLGSVPCASLDAQAPERFVVIVDSTSTRTDISLHELRAVFLGDRQFWQDGRRVVLFLPAPGTPARALLLQRIYRMRESELHRYWIAKTFRDEVALGPKIVARVATARKLVAGIPGAITVIPASEVREGVRVLTVDGRAPADHHYPLVLPQ